MTYVYTDPDAVWPLPDSRLDALEHTLRYGTPLRSDCVFAASVVAAYRELVNANKERRAHVVSKMRRALKQASKKIGGE